MKVITLIFALVFSLHCHAQRYLTDDYLALDSIIAGTYGSAINYESNNQNLLFDFYEPANDNLEERPLIIYLHGGGFATGTRTYPSVQMIARRMANKGYAVANIDYRIDPTFNFFNAPDDKRAMTDAMHDAKQAIRYFKANAAMYRIDTSLIFIGGESAGAATSMMVAYVDKQSEMATYPMAVPNNPVGSSANAGFSNDVSGAMCLCGILLDTLAMESPSDPPLLWTHGTEDNFIPIELAFAIVLRAANIGLPFQAKAYQGGVHCPWYFGNPNWSTYLDSTIMDITSFLYPIVSLSSAVIEPAFSFDLSIFPNPFRDQLSIDISSSPLLTSETSIEVLSNLGQTILRKHFTLGQSIELDLRSVEAGVYFLVVENVTQRTVRKIMKVDDR